MNLPGITADLSSRKRDIDQHGYCVIENAISAATVMALRERLLEQKDAEEQRGLMREKQPTTQDRVVKFLVNKGVVFRELLFHNAVRNIVDHVLGSTYLLSSFMGHIAHSGAEPSYHTDQWWMPPPTNSRKETFLRPGDIDKTHRGNHLTKSNGVDPVAISPACVCNCLWLLDDFTIENGGTIVVPGSHLFGRQPDLKIDEDAGWVPTIAAAGSVLVLDGRIWHSGGKNLTDENRIFLTSNFCAPQFRQQENLQLGTSKEVVAAASEGLLSLLGFKPFCGYGSMEAYGQKTRDESFVERGKYAMGELKNNDGK